MSMISSALKSQKQTLRKAISTALVNLSINDIQSQSQAITENVKSLPAFKECRSISCYLSMPTAEVDTSFLVSDILRVGKALFVPRIDTLTPGRMDFLRVYNEEELASLPPGTWGIKEPGYQWNNQNRQNVLDDDCNDLDVILLPGVAFDRSLSRLGHGKGYYDRFITSYVAAKRKRPVLVALALREQILDKQTVPMGEHDWVMDYIVGPDGVISRAETA